MRYVHSVVASCSIITDMFFFISLFLYIKSYLSWLPFVITHKGFVVFLHLLIAFLMEVTSNNGQTSQLHITN